MVHQYMHQHTVSQLLSLLYTLKVTSIPYLWSYSPLLCSCFTFYLILFISCFRFHLILFISCFISFSIWSTALFMKLIRLIIPFKLVLISSTPCTLTIRSSTCLSAAFTSFMDFTSCRKVS
uniref:Uncharacterized protein n=1 Tax=Cacopsylla melanoneura TaxID=428564 RepID=A0A8D8Z973_9HEMI